MTFVQCWTNVEDVDPTLYKCYTNVSSLLGHPFTAEPFLYVFVFVLNTKALKVEM